MSARATSGSCQVCARSRSRPLHLSWWGVGRSSVAHLLGEAAPYVFKRTRCPEMWNFARCGLLGRSSQGDVRILQRTDTPTLVALADVSSAPNNTPRSLFGVS